MNPNNPSGGTQFVAGQPVGGGRFTLVRALGRGGMGVVWLGQDTRLGEEVALKFLPPEVAADAVAVNDLRRETARSHKLTHPNIIRIHDFHEQTDGVAFISMEYVDGPTLSAFRLQQAGQVLAWEQFAPLAQQLCAALDYAHGENVIHRDLKPANVMLDAKGRLKLADFGIAAVVSDSASRVSMLGTSGTLAYMSPQQLTGKRPTATDDIYALGATFYELLTSKPPFYTGDLTHQVLHESPEPVDERLAGLGIENPVPPEVAAMIMACLAKDPAQRPQSAAAVAEWIGLTVASRPAMQGLAAGVFAQPEPATEETSVGASSNRRLVWVGAAIVGVLLLTVVGWLVAHRGSTNKKDSGVEVATSRPPLTPGASSPPRTTPASHAAADSETDFVSLFNGKDLTGWDGDPGFWSVRDGVIAGETTREHLPNGNTFLIWRGGEPGDFELSLKCRMTSGNSGIQFRSQSAGQWKITGYQAEILALGTSFGETALGALVNEPSPLLALCGERVVYSAGGQKQVVGSTGVTKEQVHAAFLPVGWNEYTIVARGNHVMLKLNGLTTVDFTDNRPSRALSGLLALQIHRNRGEGMRVEFKEIQLKRLAAGPTTASATELPGLNAGSASDVGLGQAWTNSLGMRFRQVPGTKALLSIWETRVQDFDAFVNDSNYDATSGMLSLKSDGWKARGDRWSSPGFQQSPTHPVCGINWDDAQAFCAWLTKRERQTGKLSGLQNYRLPTDAEWSAAAGSGKYPWGEQWPPGPADGNYAGDEIASSSLPSGMKYLNGRRDPYMRTAPVGSFRPNVNGFYDMGGNVWEWCEEWFYTAINPEGSRKLFGGDNDGGGQVFRVIRGASWKNGSLLPEMQTDFRQHERPLTRRDNTGFRCALAPSQQ